MASRSAMPPEALRLLVGGDQVTHLHRWAGETVRGAPAGRRAEKTIDAGRDSAALTGAVNTSSVASRWENVAGLEAWHVADRHQNRPGAPSARSTGFATSCHTASQACHPDREWFGRCSTRITPAASNRGVAGRQIYGASSDAAAAERPLTEVVMSG